MSKHDRLLAELDDQIGRFDDESTGHKNMYRVFRYLVFTLTASSTALASLSLSFPEMQTAISLSIVVITATVGVVTSIEGLRKPGELWVHERATFYNLKDIRRELEFRSADDESTVSVDELFDRMQAVLGAAGEKWRRQIVSDPSKTAQAGDTTDAPQTPNG